MANCKSAKKRILITKKKTLRNKSINSALKTQIKKADAALTSNAADKEEIVKATIKKIDQAAAKGILHKNCASRKKSQLALRLNAAK